MILECRLEQIQLLCNDMPRRELCFAGAEQYEDLKVRKRNFLYVRVGASRHLSISQVIALRLFYARIGELARSEESVLASMYIGTTSRKSRMLPWPKKVRLQAIARTISNMLERCKWL